MTEPTERESTYKASIATVDARIGRLEDTQKALGLRQTEQDGIMKMIQLEQQHIREIMTSRFVSLEVAVQAQGTKMDNFIGKMEALIEKSLEQQTDLESTPLGRQVTSMIRTNTERIKKVESWEEVSRQFHAEVGGMQKTIRFVFGGSVLAAAGSIVAVLIAGGVLK